MGYPSPLPPFFGSPRRFLALGTLLLLPAVARAQAVPRTDTPRAGELRVTVEPIITTWSDEFTPDGRQPVAASLTRAIPPRWECFRTDTLRIVRACRLLTSQVQVRAERRETPLIAAFGLTNRLALSARLPLVRVMVRQRHDSSAVGFALDALLGNSTYAFAPILNTPRHLRYFAGDIELGAKYRVLAAADYATSVAFVVRLPTGHQDSPNDLLDIPTGDHQTDIEIQAAQEVTLLHRLWLNAAVRAGWQREGTRERRVGPVSQLLLPHAALAELNWRPGKYAAIDVAPMYRFGRPFALGFTVGYWAKQQDEYSYRSVQDSIDVATRLGAPIPASVLSPGTSQRWTRIGVAMTYFGPDVEGSFSFERTVSGSGGFEPAATVFRIVMRTSRWPF
ncbi:MAG TPA: hypothetical protein VEK77_09340 [Gemmatimonadales bacterium]|nr:hypothetical protein [Gemmatimonadales bacterium]